ncbi:MAG: RNA polymerase sigma factor SigJ [Gemmatimonadota bacterium]
MKSTRSRDVAFESMRPKLFGIAYRMLRTRAEAEDVVQDAWLRLTRTPEVTSIEGFLVRTVTRLCLDHEKSARARRERYVGPWLPEPLLSVSPDEGDVVRLESINIALLHVLGLLSPLERAVFLLREVFDYSYDEVSEIVLRRPDACRQIAKRARDRVQGEGGWGSVDPVEHEQLLGAFLGAARDGDVGTLESLLTGDVVLLADGGGKVISATKPISGPNKVARFMVGVSSKATDDTTLTFERLNGLPGAVIRIEGRIAVIFLLQVLGGKIRRVFAVRNPDKLQNVDETAEHPGKLFG